MNIISAILERMEDHIQELLALGFSTDEKKKRKKIMFGSLEGSRIIYEKMDLGVI